MICLENNNNNNYYYYDEDFASFATRRFSTLTTIFGHLEGVGSHKTLDMNRYVCIKTYLYILPEISAHHLQLKCMGGLFFPCHPNIESTTVLSDKYIYIYIS